MRGDKVGGKSIMVGLNKGHGWKDSSLDVILRHWVSCRRSGRLVVLCGYGILVTKEELSPFFITRFSI